MEPGHEDREDLPELLHRGRQLLPQWSPVTKTGKTGRDVDDLTGLQVAAMEPGHEDREDRADGVRVAVTGCAAMEPGHEDREDGPNVALTFAPVIAAMEPGHEDREDADRGHQRVEGGQAAMEPGHEDREDLQRWAVTAVEPLMPQWSPVTKTGKTRA